MRPLWSKKGQTPLQPDIKMVVERMEIAGRKDESAEATPLPGATDRGDRGVTRMERGSEEKN